MSMYNIFTWHTSGDFFCFFCNLFLFSFFILSDFCFLVIYFMSLFFVFIIDFTFLIYCTPLTFTSSAPFPAPTLSLTYCLPWHNPTPPFHLYSLPEPYPWLPSIIDYIDCVECLAFFIFYFLYSFLFCLSLWVSFFYIIFFFLYLDSY